MNIKIDDRKGLNEICTKYHTTPDDLFNDFLQALYSTPPGFEDTVKRTSFSSALSRAIWNSLVAESVIMQVEQQLGKHEYDYIEDGEIALDERSFWFRISIGENEKLVDIDTIHVQYDKGEALVAAERMIEGIYATTEQLEEIQDELLDELDEMSELELTSEEKDDYFQSPEHINIELTVHEEGYEYLPRLVEINERLDVVERRIRESLKSKTNQKKT